MEFKNIIPPERKKVYIEKTKKAATKSGIQDKNTSPRKAKEEQAKARKNMKKVLAQAKELKGAELEKRAEAYAEAGNQPMEIVLREIINRKKGKIHGKRLRKLLTSQTSLP